MKKVLMGVVVSTKMTKTVLVEVVEKRPHPLYSKLLTKTKRIKADSRAFNPANGDVVKIIETAPRSKDKHFAIQEIISQGEKA